MVLPQSKALAKVTSGVTAEVRMTSSYGVSDMQLGTNPKTSTTWKPKMEYSGPVRLPTTIVHNYQVTCYGGPFPQGDVILRWWRQHRRLHEDYPDIGIEFYDNAGRYAYCELFTGNGNGDPSTIYPVYTKIAFVDGFNVKGFVKPATAVAAASWDSIQVPQSNDWGYSGVTDFGQYIATSTGTKAGKVREQPGTYSNGGGGFTVTFP